MPFLIVQALVSVGPDVKYVCRPSESYAAFTRALQWLDDRGVTSCYVDILSGSSGALLN